MNRHYSLGTPASNLNRTIGLAVRERISATA